jgi:hypothetical protein
MVLATLSAGPVGTGDAIGRENKENIFKSVRPDGVIVKPDVPLLPIDQTYIDGAHLGNAPIVASTYTDHEGIKTRYIFAFPRPRGSRAAHVDLRSLGVHKAAYVLNLTTGEGGYWKPGQDCVLENSKLGYGYLIVAPVGRSGIALLGDLGKFVPTGKQRISAISDSEKRLKVKVEFAKGERSVSLTCACYAVPIVRAINGEALIPPVSVGSSRYSIEVRPIKGRSFAEIELSRG